MKRLPWMRLIPVLIILLFVLASCAEAAPKQLSYSYNFGAGDQGWIADFCDLPENYNPEIYDLQSGLADLPAELGLQSHGFRLSGSNRSDDLFMFIKKKLGKVDGILPLHTYEIELTVEFASDAFAGGIGAGGAPGESVYVKAGASGIEPEPVIMIEGGDSMLLLNVDKGAQSVDGSNAIVIGNIAKTDGSENNDFALKTLSSSGRKLTAKSDAQGNLWLFVGTDSAYEGVTTLYYTKVTVVLKTAEK